MKHIKTYEEALNEGILSAAKELLFPTVWRIAYSVTHLREKGNDEKETDKKYNTVDKKVDIKAKNEDAAVDKFWKETEKEIAGIKPKPKVELISVYKTKKQEHKSLRIL